MHGTSGRKGTGFRMTINELETLCGQIARRVTSPELDAFASRNWYLADRLMFIVDDDATRDAIGMLLDRIEDDAARIANMGELLSSEDSFHRARTLGH